MTQEFLKNYKPTCDLILAVIKWIRKESEHPGGLYFIPLDTQKEILKKLGKNKYAEKIQSIYKTYRARKFYKDSIRYNKAGICILNMYRRYKVYTIYYTIYII